MKTLTKHHTELWYLFLVTSLSLGISQSASALDCDAATAQVKAMICKDNMTIDQTLERSIKNNSQRDVGWRSFQEDGYIDVERAILVSKATELHYRWRVRNDGSILAESERAEKLCTSN